MEDRILEWLIQLGIPGILIGSIVYLVRVWLVSRPKQPSQDRLIQSMVDRVADLNEKLFEKHDEAIDELTLAVKSLKASLDEITGKNMATRLHDVEGCASYLCDRTRKLEDHILGNEGGGEIIAGPRNYDGYVKGRENGRY